MRRSEQFITLRYCRECDNWLLINDFMTAEGLICRACQAIRIHEIIESDSKLAQLIF